MTPSGAVLAVEETQVRHQLSGSCYSRQKTVPCRFQTAWRQRGRPFQQLPSGDPVASARPACPNSYLSCNLDNSTPQFSPPFPSRPEVLLSRLEAGPGAPFGGYALTRPQGAHVVTTNGPRPPPLVHLPSSIHPSSSSHLITPPTGPAQHCALPNI